MTVHSFCRYCLFFFVGFFYFCLHGPTKISIVLNLHLLLRKILNYVSAGNLIWFLLFSEAFNFKIFFSNQYLWIWKPFCLSLIALVPFSNYAITVLMGFYIIYQVGIELPITGCEIPWKWCVVWPIGWHRPDK